MMAAPNWAAVGSRGVVKWVGQSLNTKRFMKRSGVSFDVNARGQAINYGQQRSREVRAKTRIHLHHRRDATTSSPDQAAMFLYSSALTRRGQIVDL